MKSHWRKLYHFLPAHIERKKYEQYFKNNHQKWLADGSPLPVSNFSKQKVLINFQQRFQVETFVETGTYLGDTLYTVYPYFNKLYSIELSDTFYTRALKRFKKLDKVQLLHGDSGKILSELVPALHQPAIFWLDAHYSGGMTARGITDCPIFEELKAIFKSPLNHYIFIDDARLFIGEDDYPTISELKLFLQEHQPNYQFSIENDCIRMLPQT